MSNGLGPARPSRAGSHRTVLLVLLAGTALGTIASTIAGFATRNPVLFDAAVALWLASGVLVGVAIASGARGVLREAGPEAAVEVRATVARRIREEKAATVLVGSLAVLGSFLAGVRLHPLSPSASAGLGATALLSAGLAATAARYWADVDSSRLPEAPGLSRGARVLAWVLVGTALSVVFAAIGSHAGIACIHLLTLAVNGLVCLELSAAALGEPPTFPTDLRVLAALGSRAHPLASALDAAERRFGVDLRSTWALTVVRRSGEPLFVALCIVGWLATAWTVVAPDEECLVERFGVPRPGAPLGPGLHLHWPWPVERAALVPVRRVQTLHIGHEGEEERGPEDVLWARQHAASEYTLLLGDGRDLIAIDAALQFRITNPYAWLYHDQDPIGSVRAISYRAVMKATVSRTLAEVLSENVAALAAQMRTQVQADADARPLGIEVTAFTIGGMHPPVRVAGEYQAVVSAELGKTTAAVVARADRNELVPRAQMEADNVENAARIDAKEALGKAVGEASAFRVLASAYRDAPDVYRFRRRLEALETDLDGRPITVVDERIQRDGGGLWLTK